MGSPIGDIHEQIELNAAGGVLESAVSLSVPRNVEVALGMADRRGRRPPHLAAFLIAQIQHLAGPIGDRIIRPRSDLMFAAVERPGEAAAVGRNLKSKVRIGDHIDPGRGRRLSRTQNSHVFTAFRTESAQAVEEFQIVRGGSARRRLGLRHALERRCSRWAGGLRTRSN